MKTAISTADAPKAQGPYSQAVRAGGLLFLAGQIPLDPASGEVVGATAAEQARRCLENLRAVCEAAGTTLDRALRLTVYMTDLSAFAEDPPARVAVGVGQLPRGAYVEIDAIVALPVSGAGGSAP